jgi:hypothetical protein
MSQSLSSISDLPGLPAVYALYGGKGRSAYVAYVGVATSLRGRIEQHLVRRDSSIVTGTTAVGLNPDHVTAVRWWQRSDFAKQDVLEAAELVAFDLLDPALRSRGNITERARTLYKEAGFYEEMRSLFSGAPAGTLVLHTLEDALGHIETLEKRVKELEERIGRIESRT